MRSDDINFKGILAFLGLLALTLAAAYELVGLMTAHLEKNARRSDAQAARVAAAPALLSSQPYFPEPREQPAPRGDLETLRAREETELEGYGWTDRSNGVVHIPIERAMDLMIPPQEGHP